MAALPKDFKGYDRGEAAKGGSGSGLERESKLSHGRGGAGNIGVSEADFQKPSLETPHLKGEMYTTGRGGSGNMAKNDDPELARLAQDVEAHPRRESMNAAHVGRGGAANVFHPTTGDEITKVTSAPGNTSAIATSSAASSETASANGNEAIAPPHPVGLADRGKNWLLGKLGKKGKGEKEEGGSSTT